MPDKEEIVERSILEELSNALQQLGVRISYVVGIFPCFIQCLGYSLGHHAGDFRRFGPWVCRVDNPQVLEERRCVSQVPSSQYEWRGKGEKSQLKKCSFIFHIQNILSIIHINVLCVDLCNLL